MGDAVRVVCAFCKANVDLPTGHVNRARRGGSPLYCDRTCAGMGRRKNKSKAQKVEEKRLYDMEYRQKNLASITAKKAAYFRVTYDPAAAAVTRNARMPYHVEYCRQPAYRKKKQAYDRVRRAAEYGDFAEVYMLSIDLNRAIKERATNAEIKYENETCNKTQRRRRADKAEARNRPRHRERRAGHSAANG